MNTEIKTRAVTSAVVAMYRGQAVYLTEAKSPKFQAQVAGRFYTAGSFDTLTKKLDEVLTFTKFHALRLIRKSGGIWDVEALEITGLDRSSDGRTLRYNARLIPSGDARTLDPWAELYPAEMEEELIAHCVSQNAWARQEELIKAAREKDTTELRAKLLPRADDASR